MDEDTSEIGTPAWREAIAALSMGVAAILFSFVPAQFGIDTAYGAGLALAGWLSVVAGVALLVQRTRSAAVAVLVVQASIVIAWLVVHTVDVPFGPASGGPARDPGAADTVAMLLGILAIVCTALLLRGLRPYAARPVVGGVALGCAATLALVGSIFGVAESADDGAGDHPHGAAAQDGGHAHDAEAMPAAGHDDAAHDHGAEMPSDDHSAGSGHGEHDGPMAIVPISDDDRAALADQLVEARTVAMRMETASDARAAGYIPAGPVGEGGGLHWVNLDYVSHSALDVERPMSLLYDGPGDDAGIIGMMYYLDSGDEPPAGFAGETDSWHLHTGACFILDGDDIKVPFRVDADVTQGQCEGVEGAQFIDRTGWMLHVWVVPGWESPHGVFSATNPMFTCPEGTESTGNLGTGCQPVSG